MSDAHVNWVRNGAVAADSMRRLRELDLTIFNGQSVHEACRQYLQFGTLVLPLDRAVTTNDFRAISDEVLSYREAGSFMRFALDTYGTNSVLEFFRISSRDDNLSTIKQRFVTVFGVSLEGAESAWTTMLKAQ